MEALHQLAFLQTVGPTAKQLGDLHPRLQALVDQFSAQDLQIKFQFAGIAVKEVAAAPDPRIAFEMCLLRMLAFADVQSSDSAEQDRLGKTKGSGAASAAPEPISRANAALPLAPAEPIAAPVTSARIESSAALESDVVSASVPKRTQPAGSLAERWLALVRQLDLPPGPVRELAHNALVREWRDASIVLVIDAAHGALSVALEPLKSLLSKHLGNVIQLTIHIADVDLSASPAQSIARENAQMARDFSESISENPLVKSLIREFDAKIIPGSIKFKQLIN